MEGSTDANKQEVTTMLQEMGFEPALITVAYDKAPIQTLEGVINYIEANPNLLSTVNNNQMVQEPIPNQTTEAGNKMDEEPVPTEQIDPPTEGEIPAEPQGEPISGLVNQDQVKTIQEMGYSKDVSEKALFMTQGASIESALGWIEENKDAPDFNEALFIVQGEQKSKIDPEEAKKIAKDLQVQLRKKRAEADAKMELENEAARLKSGKELTYAKRALEELQIKQHMEE